jgi:DNA-binding transcriptional regulator YdaS (Cro superfamily)
MKLKDYFFALDRPSRSLFADNCQTSVEYLMQICYEQRRPKIELAVRIARESDGKVTVEDLLPDVDWAYLRTTGA